MGEPSSSSGSGSGNGNGGSATGTTADSYIGSLISLTSKSEIRYEGILFTIDTQNSNIALQDVRSFGTEGRKKDGPQIPPSDKVYDYIIFRGSDIKDLQVKSSPPAQIHSDPAIISLQSQYSQPSQASNAFGPAASGSLPDLASHGAHSGVPTSPFRGGTPLYPATRNLGSWGSSPVPPGANGTGLAMPMYWQGYYPHVQQQPLHFQPPPGMPIPPAVQQHLQQSPVLPSLPTGLSATSEFMNSLQQTAASAQRYSESSTGAAPVSVVSTSSSTTAAGTLSSVMPMSLPSTETLNATLTPIVSSDHDVSAIVTAATSKPRSVTGPTSSLQTISQTVSVSTPLNLSTTAPPTLVTPGQLLQPGGSVSSLKSQSSTQEHKVTENSSLLSQPVIPAAPDSQPQRVSTQPLLPLPTTSSQLRTSQQVNVTYGHSGNNYRGRGRGRGRMAPHASTKFTEDFDFTAMNEKFKKDEVWGHLGKSELKVEDGEEDEKTERISEDEENSRQSCNAKPVYVKDDFFDSLSCDALDRSRNDRRFSEQRKIDTETFGSLPRSRSGRGSRGGGYRGNFRGPYYGGRGNGYSGRGRGGGRTFL